MKRDIEQVLLNWKKETNRYPLLVRGARQVGKSYSIRKFGEKEFVNLVEINFEQKPQFKECFNTLEPQKIIEAISLLTQSDIVIGESLLFLDEIQECPEAITALRYFYEQMPGVHIIGAGSLLEFVISSENLRMPVGRIKYLYMRPLSFLEYLEATGDKRARKFIESTDWNNLPSKPVHQHLLSQVKKYSLLGGMPAVVSEYVSSGNINKCMEIQTLIIQTYRDDFGKYSSRVKHKYMEKIFYAVPKLIGKKFKYSHVDVNMQSRDLNEALQLLEKAGVVYKIKQTSGNGLPLEAESKEKHFKTAFMDIGLMQNICGLNSTIFTTADEDFIKINEGAIAEQFTAQELLAYQDCFQPAALFYWAREKRSSNAEVDYVIPHSAKAIPLEVKAGKTGTLKSLHLYLENYKILFGVRVSQHYFQDVQPVVSIPFYAIRMIKVLLKNISV